MADLVPILPRRIPEGVADQVDDAGLNRGELPDGVDRVREAFQPVADRDAHVLNAAVLQLGQHLQPELRTLRPVTGPQTQDVAFSVDGDPDDHIDGFVADLAVTNLDHDGIDEDHRIHLAVSSERCESLWCSLSDPSLHGFLWCLV